MSSEMTLLMLTAVTLGVVHTAVGVDHTLPFVVLGRARGWSLKKTLLVTGLCGLGHVVSSVLVGGVGWVVGVTTGALEAFEALRGQWAAWLLIGFGSVYALVGWLRRGRRAVHRHVHVHPDGTVHTHHHQHRPAPDTRAGRVVHAHGHVGTLPFRTSRLIPALFIIFVTGPCEALIPLMFAPAAGGQLWSVWLVALGFSVATLLTMLTLVAAGYWGLTASRLARFEPHLNWSAGLAIALSGVGIQVLGI